MCRRTSEAALWKVVSRPNRRTGDDVVACCVQRGRPVAPSIVGRQGVVTSVPCSTSGTMANRCCRPNTSGSAHAGLRTGVRTVLDSENADGWFLTS